MTDAQELVEVRTERHRLRIENNELRADNERLRTTLGYLADNIDNPALVAVAEAALKPKP